MACDQRLQCPDEPEVSFEVTKMARASSAEETKWRAKLNNPGTVGPAIGVVYFWGVMLVAPLLGSTNSRPFRQRSSWVELELFG